jgi:hypothetical protein
MTVPAGVEEHGHDADVIVEVRQVAEVGDGGNVGVQVGVQWPETSRLRAPATAARCHSSLAVASAHT